MLDMTKKLTEEEKKDLLKHADEWDKIAEYYNSGRFYTKDKVRIAHRTAQSLRLEVKTGIPHCVCHLKPYKNGLINCG